VLHGRSAGRAHLSPRVPHPWRLDCTRCGLFAGALVSVGCLAQVLRGLSPIGGEPDEARAVRAMAGLLEQWAISNIS
jgi:hypothetical protein